MPIYNDHILPRLIEGAMGLEALDRYRKAVAAQARGTVLDIGFGTGLNLPHFTASVGSVIGIDPSAHLLHKAGNAAAGSGIPVMRVRAVAEAIPLPDACIDSIVMTWTLCSVRDPRLALREMRRVLKPDGILLFVEHGLAPDSAVARWQHVCDPLWSRLSCHLDNRVDTLLQRSGFAIETLDTGYMRRWPKMLTFMYSGRATVAG